MLRHFVAATMLLAGLVLPRALHADQFSLVGTPARGRVGFAFVGASMVDNRGVANGVNCLKPKAIAHVRPDDVPSRAELQSAVLYVSGTLIAEDGPDYMDPAVDLFTTVGLNADNSADLPLIEAAARAVADNAVTFRPPGAASATVVQGVPGKAYVTALHKPAASGEGGNLAFFTTRIDVTQAIRAAGGSLVGDYEVGELLADVCYGREAVCADDPTTGPTCATVSAVHTNAAASYALLLVYEDASLPFRTVGVFEGLQQLAGSARTLRLDTENPISDPASGRIATYALEGDLALSAYNAFEAPCQGGEYIEVDGDTNPDSGGLCLTDDDNPAGNLFNGTINSEPKDDDLAPTCAPADDPRECCNGDGLCGVTGVDIDRFNISSALVPGQDQVRVTVSTGSDRVALAVVVLEVDVFEPELEPDTQLRVIDDREGLVQLGRPITYSLAISNTGNVKAEQVAIQVPAPAKTHALTIVKTPGGATDLTSALGGANGTGLVYVRGFEVAAGQIAEVRFSVVSDCDSLNLTHKPRARVEALGLATFDVDAEPVRVAGPGIDGCEGIDENGPFGDNPIDQLEDRVLRGGGCASLGDSTTLLVGLAAVGWFVAGRRSRRRRGTLGRASSGPLLLTLGGLAMTSASCGDKRHVRDDEEPTPTRAITDVDSLPGAPCSSDLMVQVTRADGTTFCIDRFEAAVDGGALGDLVQAASDTSTSVNGSTLARARVALGVVPAGEVSWYQAKAACANSGKRLCTLSEWERACRGPNELIYPYGDTVVEDACNGFFNFAETAPLATGSLATCGSAFGVYDMSGNLEEWTDTAVPRVPGTTTLDDRAVRGGSYQANDNALACVGEEFRAPPGEAKTHRGFRCCAN